MIWNGLTLVEKKRCEWRLHFERLLTFLRSMLACIHEKKGCVCMYIWRNILVLTMILVLPFTGCTKKAEPPAAFPPLEDSIDEIATEFVALLAQEDFEGAGAFFDADMMEALPPSKLEAVWIQLKGQVGVYGSELGRKQEVSQGYDVITVMTKFEKAPINIRVVFNRDRRISGLFFQPAESAGASGYLVPEYAAMDKLIEKEILVGDGEWALPGTLTLPAGEGPWPMVVLVHGSGPNDRDETIGQNKPFKDLALGLASRGIGVLRYDKRTLVYGQKIIEDSIDLTVKEETIDDALSAIAFLKGMDEADSDRIYVLGHSLGGMVAPRIGEATDEIAGLIIMAGAARPLEDLMIEQVGYLANLDGILDETEKANLEELKRQALSVKDPLLDRETPPSKLMGAPAGYWLDLQDYQPAETAKTLNTRILILQGERDYQVTMEDFGIWKSALESKDGVEFQSFPDLNHLMMAGEDGVLSTPDEYMKPNHVAEEVIGAIENFVK